MYDTFIRAARPWSYRYPLEDVQGNYGNQDGPDTHAAARYVEMRASAIADCLFQGLKKNAIGEERYKNYDDTELIPSVFPSIGYWNIVNGCSGIAVALATSIPQFNLKEVNATLIKIIQNPAVDFDEIYCAPDFATGGIITNSAIVKESLRNGSGESIRLRAKLEYIPNQHAIRATELPYGVFVDTILDQLKVITTENPDYGIVKVSDHTKKFGDIVIYLEKNVSSTQMINKLYHDTALENYVAVNMIMLDKGRFPKVFGWREACDAYITHIKQCRHNEIEFDLNKALERLNIVEGLIIAAASIDEVVAIIRSSQNPSEAAQKLVARFNFNEPQVKAILAMRLAALTKIDGIKLEQEQEELKSKIDSYRYLLTESTAFNQTLIDDLNKISEQFGDQRRTKLENKTEENLNAPPEEKTIIIEYSKTSFRILDAANKIKKRSNYNYITTTNYDTFTIFTTDGLVYSLSLNQLEEEHEYKYPLNSGEKSLFCINASSFYSYQSLIVVTTKGLIKKTKTSEFNLRSKKGIAIIKLENDDKVYAVFPSLNENDNVYICTDSNFYNYYSVTEINYTGRVTKGVKAIKMDKDNRIKEVKIIYSNSEEKNNFILTGRGVKGVKNG